MTIPAYDDPPTLLLLGSGPDTDDDPTDATDLLATADAVFVGPPGPEIDPEAAVLFYAEVWRVERLDAQVAAARLAAWFDGRPSGTVAVVVAGAVGDDVAFGAALDGLARLRPRLRVRRCTGLAVVPPRRSPLTR